MDNNKIKILLVEDSGIFRNITSEMLTGYDLVVAKDAAEGIKKFEECQPDIILLDIGLPDESGLSVMEKIRVKSKSVYIVIITASRLTDDIEKALKLGANGYIVKPFSKEKIMEVIDKYNDKK